MSAVDEMRSICFCVYCNIAIQTTLFMTFERRQQESMESTERFIRHYNPTQTPELYAGLFCMLHEIVCCQVTIATVMLQYCVLEKKPLKTPQETGLTRQCKKKQQYFRQQQH